MLHCLLAVLATAALPALADAAAAEIMGRADRVVDGDTLWVCDQAACHKVRLCGIDAPELQTPEGAAAKQALQALVTDRPVRCTPVGEGTVCDGRSRRTSHDRIVGQCFVGNIDLATELVASGHACDWEGFSDGHYSRGRGEGVAPVKT